MYVHHNSKLTNQTLEPKTASTSNMKIFDSHKSSDVSVMVDMMSMPWKKACFCHI